MAAVAAARQPRRTRSLAFVRSDRLYAVLLIAGFCLLVALTWGTWGAPHGDAGSELTTAKLVGDGSALYSDVRYYYGPLGISLLTLAIELFGPGLDVAFAFGLLQFAAILAVFHTLARVWLEPAFAALATAIVMAVGFTGQLFGFILPHTFSATLGLLALLALLLALSRERLLPASLALGAACLTRPEFAGAALVAAAGYLIGLALAGDGRDRIGAAALRLLVPGLAAAVAVLVAFGIAVGFDRLLFENLFPLDFVRVAGNEFFREWAPFTITSAIALAFRALLYLTPLAGAAAALVLWRRGERLRALWPLLAAAAVLLLYAALTQVLGAFPGTRGVVQTEAKRLLLGMSWLPALVGAAGVLAIVRAVRRQRAPLSGSWPLDLALLAAAGVLCLRAYNRFTTDVYAAYYVAPAVVVAGVFHQWIARRWPEARPVALAAMAAVALTLAVSALTGPAGDDTLRVQTPRGSYLAAPGHGQALQHTLDFVRANTDAGEPILALPTDGGVYYLADRPPALYETQVVPGSLDSLADERAAFERLRRERVRVVVLGNASFDAYGFPGRIGDSFNSTLIDAIRRDYELKATYGDFDGPSLGPQSTAYRVYVRRGSERS